MDKDTFDLQRQSIANTIKDALGSKDALSTMMNKFPEELEEYFKDISSIIKEYKNYMDLLSEFSFSDKLTTPSDLFPGIRTANQSANFDELRDKAASMKKSSEMIDNLRSNLGVLSTRMTTDLKRSLGILAEMSFALNEALDSCNEVVRDMDSPYDIGMLVNKTK